MIRAIFSVTLSVFLPAVFLPAVFLVTLSCLVDAQEAETQEQKDARYYHPDQMKLWGEYYSIVSKQFDARIEDENQPDELRELVVSETPIMTWRNPASGYGTHGQVYSWSDDGYPVILGALWSKEFGQNRNLLIEAHSLLDQPMTLSRERFLWEPVAAADRKIEIPNLGQDIPDSLAMRTGELESIISRFAVASERDDTARSIDLRVEEKLVHRFSSEKYKVIDGAMFVAYYNNDPELFFVFEAIQHDNYEQWYVRFIRHTNQPLAVSFDEKPLWEYRPEQGDSSFGGPQEPTIFRAVERLPRALTPEHVEQ